MNKSTKFNLAYIIFAIFGVLVLRDLYVQSLQIETIPYSEFLRLLREDKIEQIYVTQDKISGSYKEPKEGRKKEFVTVRVDNGLAKDLSTYNVKVTGIIPSTLLKDLLSWFIPAIVFFMIWLVVLRYLAKRGGGIGGNFLEVGKSRAKVYVETQTKVSFRDVAGVDEAKEELQEIVNFLKDPKAYSRLGARIPKGILLVGPPGTGKTLLAKAVAGEAAVSFLSISGSEFVEMFVGVGAARVRDLFDQASKRSPCIIFIDELDALGAARGIGRHGGHDEKEQTLNQLLVELDGFDSRSGIVILAATNRPEILDPALLRAGRFDRQILVDRPDKIARLEILRVHIKKISKLDESVNLEEIAAITPGFTGADLANLVNEAALFATRRNAEKVTANDFTVAIERIIAGLEKKNRVLNPKERKIVAVHEMGHALVAASLPEVDKVHKVSIIPRGIGALGYTIQRPTEDRFLMTREELEAKIIVLLGGRAAEYIVFGHYSTGAADDLAKATDIARGMVLKYGMCESLGSVAYDDERKNLFLPSVSSYYERTYSNETAREIDTAIKETVDLCYSKAKEILTKAKDVLLTSSELLLQKETLVDIELKEIFKKLTVAK